MQYSTCSRCLRRWRVHVYWNETSVASMCVNNVCVGHVVPSCTVNKFTLLMERESELLITCNRLSLCSEFPKKWNLIHMPTLSRRSVPHRRSLLNSCWVAPFEQSLSWMMMARWGVVLAGEQPPQERYGAHLTSPLLLEHWILVTAWR